MEIIHQYGSLITCEHWVVTAPFGYQPEKCFALVRLFYREVLQFSLHLCTIVFVEHIYSSLISSIVQAVEVLHRDKKIIRQTNSGIFYAIS